MEELTASYFLGAWHDASSSSKPERERERERESSPKALEIDKNSRGFAVVGPDRLSASLPHASQQMNDWGWGIVWADRAAPQKRLVYYFEVFVKNAGAMGRVFVGFTVDTTPNSSHHPSCTYYVFPYSVEAGDTVGFGVNYATKQFFFTENGVLSGSVMKNVESGPVFPTIILRSENEVTVNFGKTPFLFDLKAYIADHRARLQKDIDQMEIARCDGFRMVRSYLQHYGYEETLRLFDMDVETEALVQENGSNEEDNKYALSQRKTIRQVHLVGISWTILDLSCYLMQ